MFLRRLATFLRDRRGNVGIIFALTAVPAIGVVGAGLDFARYNRAKAAVQTVLDGAVLSGVAAEGSEIATAQSFFNAQSDRFGLKTVDAAFAFDGDGVLTGTATGTLETTLLGVMNIASIGVGAQAAARLSVTEEAGEESEPVLAGRICVLLVDPNAGQSLLANSGASINAPGCEVHVRSTANPAAIFNGGTNLNVQTICVKGSRVIVNGSARPPVETSCAAIDDPYAGKLPTVTVPTNCNFNGTNYNANGADVTLAAGNHCNVNINSARNVYMKPGVFSQLNFNGSPKIWMEPGLYIFRNSTNINSGTVMTGAGVTIYFADANSKIQFNGNVTLDLSAPGAGSPYEGILFFEPPGLNRTQLVFNNTNNTVIQGMMYLPSRNVTFNSVSNLTAHKVMMVFNTMIMNATGWTFSGSDRAIPIYEQGPPPTPVSRRSVMLVQ